MMSRARGQIRQPLDSRAQVVDLGGRHARRGARHRARARRADLRHRRRRCRRRARRRFFSGPGRGARPAGRPERRRARRSCGEVRDLPRRPDRADRHVRLRRSRSVGNLSRPYFPDGEVGTAERAVVAADRPVQPLLHRPAVGAGHRQRRPAPRLRQRRAARPTRRSGAPRCRTPRRGQNRLQNGIQIFPGSVPIYRGGTLVGGIGVSGDGIDQDDMIASSGSTTPACGSARSAMRRSAIRADQHRRQVNGRRVRLRYVNCPFAPFLDTSEQNVCQGL